MQIVTRQILPGVFVTAVLDGNMIVSKANDMESEKRVYNSESQAKNYFMYFCEHGDYYHPPLYPCNGS